jgi:hypothetical protein
LSPGAGPDLAQRLPEAERPVAGGELGRKREPVLVAQAEQQLAPALGALPPAVLDREQLLPAARVGTDEHQHALPIVFQPRREVDTIGPKVDVAAGGEIAPAPALVLGPPALAPPPNGRGRQARCSRPEQRRQGFLELTRRHALQIQPGQQFLDVPGPAQVRRQDRRGEPDRLTVIGCTIAHPGPTDLDGADPGLDPPLRRMTVPDDTATALLIRVSGMAGEERLDLRLDRLHQHPPGSLAQHRQKRIVGEARSWPGQGKDGILLHGVSSW